MTDDKSLIEHWRVMYRVRRFEELLLPLFAQGRIRGSTHLAIGQEAVAAGFAAVLTPSDYVFATYRGHHHLLAAGSDPMRAFAEILGRTDGLCGGRGGSMHLTDTTRGFLGENAIVGAHLPIAVGAAWSAQLRETGQVTVCFFGDGTTTIGAFHEALNLAALWELPVIFVCENNLYSEYSRIDTVCPVPDPAGSRASSYGLRPIVVDGNDVVAVEEIATELVDKARSGKGCALVEAKTYRHLGHSRSDPAAYRPKEEVAEWLARDPISTLEHRLVPEICSEQQLGELRRIMDDELGEALDRALESPEPSPESLMDHLFATPTEIDT